MSKNVVNYVLGLFQELEDTVDVTEAKEIVKNLEEAKEEIISVMDRVSVSSNETLMATQNTMNAFEKGLTKQSENARNMEAQNDEFNSIVEHEKEVLERTEKAKTEIEDLFKKIEDVFNNWVDSQN